MSLTVSEIADALGASVVGDTSLEISGINQPDLAESNQLALAMDAKYSNAISHGAAKAAILWEGADWQNLGLLAAIFVARPRFAMAQLTSIFEIMPYAPVGIHDSAYVSKSAKIGKNVSIGAFVVIEPNVSIGADARILSHCSIGSGSQIGENCLIYHGVRIGRDIEIGKNFVAQPNAIIGSDGFSFVSPQRNAVDSARAGEHPDEANDDGAAYARINSLGGVTIGDNVEIGANATIDRGTVVNTFIGDGTKIDNLVQIGHNVNVGKNCLLCAQVGVGGSAVIGDGCVLAGQVGVADNVTIGKNVVAAGKSGISSNVPPNRFIMGNPAIKMEANVESYKAYRRLPKLVAKVEKLQIQVSKMTSKD